MINTNPPAQRTTIASLQPGQRLEEEVYRIASKDLRTTSNGGLYIHAVLADGTGQILARMWNATQALYDAMPEGGFLYFRGRVESYKGARQFIIDGVRSVPEGAVTPRDFLPHTPYSVEPMWSRVKEILRQIKHPDLLALVARFMKDEAFTLGFQLAPAARTHHHAYLGGLLEHTLNLLELALLVTPRYPQLSPDLVLAGIFLHDAGKVAELAYEANFEYTDEGQLLGHIVQAVLWIQNKAREIERDTGTPFPTDVLNMLQHVILAHHGKYEFGSPKLPAIPEAVLVHYLDNLDAKIHMMLGEIAKDNDPAARWTNWVSALETKVFKADPFNTRGNGPTP